MTKIKWDRWKSIKHRPGYYARVGDTKNPVRLYAQIKKGKRGKPRYIK